MDTILECFIARQPLAPLLLNLWLPLRIKRADGVVFYDRLAELKLLEVFSYDATPSGI